MKRKTIVSIILAGTIATTANAAFANVTEGDGTDTEAQVSSANEQIVADAWKSDIHALKAAAFESVD